MRCFETADDEFDLESGAIQLGGIVVRRVRDGNGFPADPMKRTEIIIETRRVTIIQHRARSTEVFSGGSHGGIETTEEIETGQDETGNEVVQGEEKERCTDSKNR